MTAWSQPDADPLGDMAKVAGSLEVVVPDDPMLVIPLALVHWAEQHGQDLLEAARRSGAMPPGTVLWKARDDGNGYEQIGTL